MFLFIVAPPPSCADATIFTGSPQVFTMGLRKKATCRRRWSGGCPGLGRGRMTSFGAVCGVICRCSRVLATRIIRRLGNYSGIAPICSDYNSRKIGSRSCFFPPYRRWARDFAPARLRGNTAALMLLRTIFLDKRRSCGEIDVRL